MQIKLQYAAQIKAAVGRSQELVDVPDAATLQQVVRAAADRHGEGLRRLLLRPDGSVRRAVLLFLGDECVSIDQPIELKEGDTLTIMSPISGG